jgi:NADH dehydrogenase FAD-containing subunit
METMTQQVVVIGAGYGGLLAAVRLAGKTNRVARTVTLVNASDLFVERLRLHEFAANQPIKRRPISDVLRGTDINFVQGTVTTIDTAGHCLVVQTASGERSLGYDRLLYALGSTIDRDRVPGIRDYAYTLTPSGPMSAAALREALPNAHAGARLLICGGGATGIEAAAEFVDSYPQLKVTLATCGTFGGFIGDEVAAYMRKSLERRGVAIRDHTTVTALRSDGAATTSGDTLLFDLCLWAGGFGVPALARESGLSVNERGQVLIDPTMRSISHPDIYAIGDAAWPVEPPGYPVRMAAFTAIIMGAHGADCLSADLHGTTPQPFSFAYVGQGIALGHNDAIGFGKTPDDVAHGPYFTGRAGYAIRSFGLNLLASLPSIEKRRPGLFTWTGKGIYAANQRRASLSERIAPTA